MSAAAARGSRTVRPRRPDPIHALAALSRLALLGLSLLAGAAAAHPLAPALLQVEETAGADGAASVLVTWKAPLQQPAGSDVRPELPGHCRPVGQGEASRDEASYTLTSRFDCGAAGLVGATVAVRGLGRSGTNALLRVALRDGRRVQAVLHGDAPALRIPERQGATQVVRGYGGLGFEHILGGLDHLVFVFGLVLLVRGARALLATVTAFTLGHSVTLSLSALGFVGFPSAWVELVIAGTILALALELARPASPVDSAAVRVPPGRNPGGAADARPWMRRFPWAMAFGFGLLHGLGFAGALAEVGLPEGEIPLALFSFNGGIELGQLAFVGVVLAGRAALHAPLAQAPPWLSRAPVHAMGGLAVYWCLDRGAQLL